MSIVLLLCFAPASFPLYEVPQLYTSKSLLLLVYVGLVPQWCIHRPHESAYVADLDPNVSRYLSLTYILNCCEMQLNDVANLFCYCHYKFISYSSTSFPLHEFEARQIPYERVFLYLLKQNRIEKLVLSNNCVFIQPPSKVGSTLDAQGLQAGCVVLSKICRLASSDKTAMQVPSVSRFTLIFEAFKGIILVIRWLFV